MLRLLTALVVLNILNFAAFAAPAPEDTNAAFQKGLAAYQKRDFAGARDRFREAVAQGPVTPRLLHNLALAHYQANERAYALAYWRKALVIDPNYGAALTGRDLLENHMHMRPFEKDGPELSLRHALERVPAFLTSWVLAVLIALFAWRGLKYAAARRAARDEERAGPGAPPPLIALAVLVLATAGLLTLKLRFGLQARATVVTDHAAAKSLPNVESATLFELPPGNEVLVKRAGDGWSQVQTSDGSAGWVKDSDLVVTSE